MKPVRFGYAVPLSVDAVLPLLSRHGSAAVVLAGGQSLMPLLARRRVRPEVLIDLNRTAGMDGISVKQGSLRIGAMTRQREIEYSGAVAVHAPLLGKAIKYVGNPATRNRGTLGGSIVHADPSAEIPACMVCLDATFHLVSERGERKVPAADFFRGRNRTELASNEVLLSIDIVSSAERPTAFLEISRRARDQAIVGAAARITTDGDAVAVLFGVDERPFRIGYTALEAAWPISQPLDDEIAAFEHRKRLARVLALRAFREIAA
jgi:CO/xanthine dehydrogenase FAD-binding subunit